MRSLVRALLRAAAKLLLICSGILVIAAEPRILPDIEFARPGNHPLKLDLYLPESRHEKPLIVWVHGGAWRSGTRKNPPLAALTKEGYAVASVDYRLSPVARFPAQIHDIKAAIRFLRAQGSDLGVNPRVIVVAGASAGGHLAILVGVSNGHQELEGTVGTHGSENSDVQAIISFFGAANLTTILGQSTPHGLSVRTPALELLLGGLPEDHQQLARLASPVFHVDAGDPPLLLFHGDQDPQMPINQAHEITGAYKAAGCNVQFETLYGAGHGGTQFYEGKSMDWVKQFLAQLHQP